nr:hypothetical protein [Tanacetum cinerariifolium]
MEAGGKDRLPMLAHCSPETRVEGYMETCKNVSQDIKDQLDVEAKMDQIILTGIDNDIYTTVDACPKTCEMWKAIESLKQGESINVQDLETNLYWEFRKFTSRDGELLKSYYSRQQQAANRNKGKAIVNSSPPTYDQEPDTVAKDDALSKEKKIDKLMALISLSSEKIYKATNNNLRTSSNTSREHQDKTLRINRGTRYDNQRVINAAEAKENESTQVVQQSGIHCYNCKEFRHIARGCQKLKRAKDVAYHKEKMLLCKQEKARFKLNADHDVWKDNTDKESNDQELEAHYMYMEKIQEVHPDAEDSGPIFDAEPLDKVQTNDDFYNMFSKESEHPKQLESVIDTYPD